MTITIVKRLYKVFRSVFFTAIIAVVALYIGLYVFLSIPPIQNYINERVQKELSNYLGGEVRIGKLEIYPFNELRLSDVELINPAGEKCVEIERIGAGIRLWRLIKERRIEITYGEIIGLNGKVTQKEKDGPLNITYIIEALSPKHKSKPPTQFDLMIHNIVIRKTALSFDREWMPRRSNMGNTFDINHISVYDLMADVTLPLLKNEDFVIDLRRLSFKSGGGFEVNRLSLKAHVTSNEIVLNNFLLFAGRTELKINNQSISYGSFNKIPEELKNKKYDIHLTLRNFYPEDFKFFYPPLGVLKDRFELNLSARGGLKEINIEDFSLNDGNSRSLISLSGIVKNPTLIKTISANISHLNLDLPYSFSSQLMKMLPIKEGDKIKIERYLEKTGDLGLKLKGHYSSADGSLGVETILDSSLGNVIASADGYIKGKGVIKGKFDIKTGGFKLGQILENDDLNELALDASGDIDWDGKEINGEAFLRADYVDFKGHRISNILAQGKKQNRQLSGTLKIDDVIADLTLEGAAELDGVNSQYIINGEIKSFNPSLIGILPKYEGYNFNGIIAANIMGNDEDNLTGYISLDNFSFLHHNGKGIYLNSVRISSSREYANLEEGTEAMISSIPSNSGLNRLISVETDFLTAKIEGDFKFRNLIWGARNLISENLTDFVKEDASHNPNKGYANFEAILKADAEYPSFFKLPVKPLKDISIRGGINLEKGMLEVLIDAPYLLQGSNKLISETHVFATVEREKGGNIIAHTIVPIKNDRAELELNIHGLNNVADADLGWTMKKNQSATGSIGLQAALNKNITSGKPEIKLMVKPSKFRLGPSEWNVDSSEIEYHDKQLRIESLRVVHDNQFVEIDGIASEDPLDRLDVRLSEIDLSYIFGILNINYVSFGGFATGELSASSVFTKAPVAKTKELFVKDLSYNDAVLGDAEIFSCWNNNEKEIEIHADVNERKKGSARIDGGIFITRDSLSFDMKANQINISFLKPFMSAFTSDVGGRASGEVKLFGNFKDIDLTGKAFADSIYMKVDYTNVYYHGSDSVLLHPGRIEIPSFRLYDRFNNSAVLTGEVKHSYFHDPVFEFKIDSAEKLLCYDTNSRINPDWYGTIFASGRGSLKGRPGIVAMEMDMTTNEKSDFTFVLNDTQTALDYTFLTFSDKKKEEIKDSIVIEETFEEKFMKKQEEIVNPPTLFTMDLRATVTPGARLNLIMDPNAGDKIVARGGGPLLIHYDTESDEMTMYGKYTLKEGSYNFSLQELILREFTIKEGSNISFNGDPLAANLDIVAAYRVNTNLSDLDKSFSTDRDLNRTNVPVDALLNVRGDLQSPDISFDLSLPTLTGDVERKVRSIISTEDQMNRQIIYLLALNRFYTPEYMGSSSNGSGELASVASSTISSQLSNIMGQLTDKFTVSPSFRSDKGDFSDMEVDVSLSSRLLNNRLLLNGNFGYRDKSTSQTTFVGDFDLEYLLSRNGNLRLKAYNHFNDQNYYLKSSLTTQGIGIVFQKDFDNPFGWLRRRKKVEVKKDGEDNNDKGNYSETSSSIIEGERQDTVSNFENRP